MKKLFIIRHGKATHELMPDIKRYLTEKGIKRTKKYTKILEENGIKPDLIVSSPAVRAFQTAEIIKELIKYPDDIDINSYFYFYPIDEIIQQIKNFPNKKDIVFIVGHNPIWTELADRFSENGLWHLRTSGIVGIQFASDTWQNIDKVKREDVIKIN